MTDSRSEAFPESSRENPEWTDVAVQHRREAVFNDQELYAILGAMRSLLDAGDEPAQNAWNQSVSLPGIYMGIRMKLDPTGWSSKGGNNYGL